MAKFVIETVQNIKRTYYVEVDNQDWATDSIVMEELEEYAQEHLTEDFISIRKVDKWSNPEDRSSVNGATYHYDYETESWVKNVVWDFNKLGEEDPIFL